MKSLPITVKVETGEIVARFHVELRIAAFRLVRSLKHGGIIHNDGKLIYAQGRAALSEFAK